jgi:hypothetical protein
MVMGTVGYMSPEQVRANARCWVKRTNLGRLMCWSARHAEGVTLQPKEGRTAPFSNDRLRHRMLPTLLP